MRSHGRGCRMGKKIISLELQTKKFTESVNKLITATNANTKDVLTDGTVEFADFAAKYTMPDEGSKYIKKSRYKREIKEIISRRKLSKSGKSTKKIFSIAIKRRGKGKIIRYANSKSKLKKYEKVDYRGLGRAGWFLNINAALNRPLTPAESKLLSMSPKIRRQSNINEITLDKDTATITNNAPQIQNYARIALAQGYRAAARKMNRTRLEFLKKQESEKL